MIATPDMSSLPADAWMLILGVIALVVAIWLIRRDR